MSGKKKPARKANGHHAIPPPHLETEAYTVQDPGENDKLLGYGEVFPTELHRDEKFNPVEGGGFKDGASKKNSNCTPALATSSAFCCCYTIFIALLLGLLIFYFAHFSLYNTVTKSMMIIQPMLVVVLFIVFSMLICCCGVVPLALESKQAYTPLAACTCCCCCVLFILFILGIIGASTSFPFAARAGNEVCRDFTAAPPKACGGTVTYTTPAPSVKSAPAPASATAPSPAAASALAAASSSTKVANCADYACPSTMTLAPGVPSKRQCDAVKGCTASQCCVAKAASSAPAASTATASSSKSTPALPFGSADDGLAARRRLLGSETTIPVTPLDDIDLDDVGADDALPVTPRRLADPGHKGATSWLDMIRTGGANMCKVHNNPSGKTKQKFQDKGHKSAVVYLASIDTTAECTDTTNMCKANKEWSATESCTCSGETALVGGKNVGGYCEYWAFDDKDPWCFVASTVKNCGTSTLYMAKQKSSGPCGSLVVPRSKALTEASHFYLIALVIGLVLAIMTCCMGIAAIMLGRSKKKGSYRDHPDHEYFWSDLDPKHRANWQTLGWTRESWDGNLADAKMPRSETTSWGRLSTEERRAASELGFTESSWDRMQPRDVEMAKQDPAAYQATLFIEDKFQMSQEKASRNLTEHTPTIKRLEIYALYHQATQGDVTGHRPDYAHHVEQQKYDAWSAKKGWSRERAMTEYIKAVDQLPPAAGSVQNPNWEPVQPPGM